MKKRIFQMVFAIMLFLTFSCNKLNAQEIANNYSKIDNAIIAAYYNTINNGDWNGLISLMGSEYGETMQSYIDSTYYQENKLGVYSIEKVTSYENHGVIDSAYYLPILDDCEGDDIKIYLVSSDIETVEENEFYFNGTNYNLIFVGTVDSERKIVAFRMPLPETVEEYMGSEDVMNYSIMRFGGDVSTYSTGSCSFNTLPSTIKVARWQYGDGSIESVDFQKYVKVVACKEVGYVNKDEDYHYAGILAIRNYGWYYVVTADSNAQYHVTDTNEINDTYKSSYQKYIPDLYWNNSTWNTMYTRVEYIWRYNFYSSDYNRIYSWYTTESGKGEANSGRMNLFIAEEYANAGKDYQYILNKFYGNSYQSPGDLTFNVIGNHVYYRVLDMGSSYSFTCRCGHIMVMDK